MQPKIAYLVDESHGWDEGPHWKFYTEEEYRAESFRFRHLPVTRIVYWEIENESV
jgi:hypothetical protein